MSEYRSIWNYLFDVPHRLAWIDVDGVSTRYLEAGSPDAPKLILLHGTAGSFENFCANIGPYAQHFHVFALDMIGCGLTDKPDYPYTAKIYEAHLSAFMDRLGIRSAGFVGVSLGSWIASRLALDEPEKVERIVAISPAGIILDRQAHDAFVAALKARRSGAVDEPSWDSIHAVIRDLMLDEKDVIPDLVAVRLALYRRPEMRRAMPHLLHMTNGEFVLEEADWRSLTIPYLTVAAVDVDNKFLKSAYRIAELTPQGQVIEMHGCDHWAQFEQADAFNRASIAFLKGAAIGDIPGVVTPGAS